MGRTVQWRTRWVVCWQAIAIVGMLLISEAAAQSPGNQNNTNQRTTGKGAQHAPSIHCQMINGKPVWGPYQGTGRNIPCPRQAPPVAVPPPTPPRQVSDIVLVRGSVERCSATFDQIRPWNPNNPPPAHSRCAKPAPRDMPNLRLHTMRDAAELVFSNYKTPQFPNREPILIAQIANHGSRYLVAVSGTEIANRQATFILEDILASFGILDPLSLFILSAFHEYDAGRGVPHGAELVFVGHSLGGMVSQNVAANRQRFFRWTPVKVLTIGSPKTADLAPGLVAQFAGRGDPVPMLSLKSAANLGLSHIYVDSGAPKSTAPGDFVAHHMNYPRSQGLARYSAMGDPR